MKAEVAIVVGFDRSGTSAVSQTAARHPEIELLWRSFNSGSIRKKMNIILDDESASDADRGFLKNLERGVLDSSYIKTPYHWKTSTVQEELIPGHVHFLISNINHFATPWTQKTFPGIGHWALWRDPFDILQSCVENGFLNEWYEAMIPDIQEAVLQNDFLNENLQWSHEHLTNETRKTAYILAAKNLLLFDTIQKDRIIDYDLFRNDPNAALSGFVKSYGLASSFDFSDSLESDLNTIPGKVPYVKGRVKQLDFNEDDRSFLNQIIRPIYEAAAYPIKAI